MADTARVQLCDQLIQELEEVLRERLGQRQSSPLDPFSKKDISALRDDSITRGAPRVLVHDGAWTVAARTWDRVVLWEVDR